MAIGKHVEAGAANPTDPEYQVPEHLEALNRRMDRLLEGGLTPAQESTVAFRSYKKMVLWDVVLGIAKT